MLANSVDLDQRGVSDGEGVVAEKMGHGVLLSMRKDDFRGNAYSYDNPPFTLSTRKFMPVGNPFFPL